MIRAELESKISARMVLAKKSHPGFACGQWEALGFLGEEYGEVSKEITKGKDGWEKRMDSELIDLIVVMGYALPK